MATQKEIHQLLAEEFQIPVLRTQQLLHRYLQIMTTQLVQEQRIEIPDLGVFAIHTRPKRKTLHPKTGKPITIEEKKAVRYRSARELRRRLNPPKPAKAPRKPRTPKEVL